MTNYEKIKNMSVEEMADYIAEKIEFCDGCFLPADLCRKYLKEARCNKAWLEWLNQEAKE